MKQRLILLTALSRIGPSRFESDFLAARKFSEEEICGMFAIPREKLTSWDGPDATRLASTDNRSGD
jgi:hypothetical protein